MKKKTDKVDVSEEETESKMGVYEVGYLMVPSIAEENLAEEVTKLKDIIKDSGATFISDENPKMIELAYEMSRSIENKKQYFSYGYFGWIKFETTTVDILKIKKILDGNEKLIRFLLINTVRESTLSLKRPYGKTDGVKRRTVTKQESMPIDEKVLDKEIDALVTE